MADERPPRRGWWLGAGAALIALAATAVGLASAETARAPHGAPPSASAAPRPAGPSHPAPGRRAR